MWCWSGGRRISIKLSLCYSIVYCYNGAQRYEQFLEVGCLYWALIFLGIALCLPSASMSSLFMVVYTLCPKKVVHQICGDNLSILNGFSKFFWLLEREVNFQQQPYNTSHHTFTGLLHYLAKVTSWSFGICCRETTRRFVSLNILLSHSRSLEIIRNDTE